MPDRPQRIGPYRVVGTLGEGGMGVVYVAEQREPVRRQVALKIVKRSGTDSEQVLRRFEVERQALAVMDHPSIAKIFDAGVTEDGRPFFVMELVQGSPLARYCDERKLTIRARAALFMDVCQGVQHAHQKGVIHRDLKPSNILVSEVGGRPLPRIIDFGIAKATAGNPGDGTRLTTDDQVIGTPAYMSPEQVLGSDDIDTRSDVYALGTLLYEVLVGALPHGETAYRGWAAVAATLHRDPPTPKRRFAELGAAREDLAEARSTAPAVLSRELGGDAGWIAMRAMERDRSRRYETAHGMALDLRRYLRHEPVRARRATSAYLLQKFVRRHRMPVAFGATVVVGLASFSVVTTLQAERVARARDEADARRGQAEELIDFMLNDLRGKLEPLGQLGILDDVGAEATHYFSSIPADQYSDDELASRSQALYQIGRVRLDQGQFEGATEAFAESLRLAQALSSRAPDDVDRLFGLSQSHFYVGYAAYLEGELALAEREFQSYLAAAERLVVMEPDNLDYQLELGFAHGNLGSVREARGDLEGAAKAYTRTLAAKQALVDRDSTQIDWLGELAETHNKLAVVNRKRGLYAEAAEGHRVELALKRRVLAKAPEHAYWRYRAALALGFLSEVRRGMGDLEEAHELIEQEHAVLDSLVAFDGSNTRWRRGRAIAQQKLASVLLALGRPGEAGELLARGEDELEALVRMDSTSFRWHLDLAAVRTTQAELLFAIRQLDSALSRAESAVALVEREPTPNTVTAIRLATAQVVRGDILAAQGRRGSAISNWEGALEVLDPLATGAQANERRPLRTRILLKLGRLREAESEYARLRASGFVDPRLQALAREKGVG